MRTTVSARRNVLLTSGLDLGEIFGQNDIHRSGFIPRVAFASILRDCGIPISESTMHFLIILLSKPTDTTMVSYVRFLDMTGGGMGSNSWATGAHSNPFSHPQSSWSDARSVSLVLLHSKLLVASLTSAVMTLCDLADIYKFPRRVMRVRSILRLLCQPPFEEGVS